MSTEATSKNSWPVPLPTIDPDSAPYWAAAREGRLGLPHCLSCGHYFFYPRSICPECWSDKLELASATGKGTIYSFTVIHRHPNPAFNTRVPYVIALVDLAEGPRMLTAVRNEPAEVKIGAAVEVIFEEISAEISLPCFRLSTPLQ